MFFPLIDSSYCVLKVAYHSLRLLDNDPESELSPKSLGFPAIAITITKIAVSLKIQVSFENYTHSDQSKGSRTRNDIIPKADAEVAR
jgi:hypothetical protein